MRVIKKKLSLFFVAAHYYLSSKVMESDLFVQYRKPF